MQERATVRLANAIGYPDPVSGDAPLAVFNVDGEEITAEESGGRLLLRATLAPFGDDPGRAATLAGYAAGRILREEATLAYDPQEDAIILWHAAPVNLPHLALRTFFEQFTASWDWWRARVAEFDAPEPSFPEVVIRP